MSDDFSGATPRPWAFNENSAPNCWLEGADGSTVWHVDEYGNHPSNEADARLIVTAVNERDAMIAERDTLRQVLEEAKRALNGFKLKEDMIVAGQAEHLVLRVPLAAIAAAAAALARIHQLAPRAS